MAQQSKSAQAPSQGHTWKKKLLVLPYVLKFNFLNDWSKQWQLRLTFKNEEEPDLYSLIFKILNKVTF